MKFPGYFHWESDFALHRMDNPHFEIDVIKHWRQKYRLYN